MDAARLRSFFLQPTEPAHRQYEVLRAILVEEQPLQEVAQRFGYRYDSVRALLGRFRRQLAAGRASPFLPRRAVAVPTRPSAMDPRRSSRLRRPMSRA